MGDRSVRHTYHRPTKEVFYIAQAAVGGATVTEYGAFVGVLVNADGNQCYLIVYVPHDFSALEELRVVLIPGATLTPGTPMTVTVQIDHGKPNEPYNQHTKTLAKSFTAVQNILTELDITDLVDGASVLEARDYFGALIQRVSGQNTQALILGIRLKYQYK